MATDFSDLGAFIKTGPTAPPPAQAAPAQGKADFSDLGAFIKQRGDTTPEIKNVSKPNAILDTLSMTARKMNPEALLSSLGEIDTRLSHGDYSGAMNEAKDIATTPFKLIDHIIDSASKKDFKELASDLLPLLAVKGGPEAAEATGAAARSTVAAAKATPLGESISEIAAHPAVQALGKTLVNKGVKSLVGYRGGQAFSMIGDLVNTYKNVKADVFGADEAPPSPAPPAAPAPVAAQVQVKPVDVTAPKIELTANAGKGFQSDAGIDSDTQIRLARAAQMDKLSSLPAESKKTLVEAVKQGNSAAVNQVLDGHTGLARHAQDVSNKIAILVKFAKDHDIDVDAIAPDQRQAFADGAIAYAKQKGHGVLPRSGKYRGVSDDSMKAVSDQIGPDDPAPF